LVDHVIRTYCDGSQALVDTARIVGGYVWLEERLFETLGGWVPSIAEAEAKLHLDADSHHHAWHASLWRERLPALAEFPAEQFVAPASPAMEALVAALRASAGTIERLVGAYRVLLPRQVGMYQHHRERASAITDGPVIRALDLVLAEELNDWRRGEHLLQGLLGDAGDIQRAATRQAVFETLALAAFG
jgi:hypothetical protein